MNATTAEELEEVTGEIHDAFFDVDDVVFDRDLAQVVIPFRRWSYDEARRVKQCRLGSTWEPLWYRWFLAVTVEETGERLGLARYRQVFGGESYSGEVFPLTPD